VKASGLFYPPSAWCASVEEACIMARASITFADTTAALPSILIEWLQW
jgi:hypothetical protein